MAHFATISHSDPPTGGVSWLGLVADTMLGERQLELVRTSVSGDVRGAGDTPLRLIAQAYFSASLGADGRPGLFSRPVGSAQRVVSAQELKEGVKLDIFVLTADELPDLALVAWVEPDSGDSDLDALEVRPSQATLGRALSSCRSEHLALVS